MKSWPFFAILLKSYRNNKFNLMMLMTSLIIAAGGLSAVLVINSSAKQSYSSDQQFLVSNVTHAITSSSTKFKLTQQDYAALRRKGFNQVVAVAQTRQHVYSNKQTTKKITQRPLDFTGIDIFSLLSLPSYSNSVSLSEQASQTHKTNNRIDSENNSLINGFSLNEPTAVLHPQLHKALNNQITSETRSQFVDLFLTASGVPLPKLKTIENASLGNDIIMDIAELYRLYPSSELSMLLVVGELTKVQRNDLQKVLPNHLQLSSSDVGEQNSELTSSFHLNLMAMALLMFVVCLFIVVNAVNLLLNSRLKWLKICRQLGISRSQLFIVQLFEISLVTLLSSLLGVVVGIELAKLASPGVQATLENLYSVEVGFGTVSFIGLFLQVAGICLFGSLCATFIPLNKLNHQLAQTKDVLTSEKQQRSWRYAIWCCCFTFAGMAYFILNIAQNLGLLLLATALVILAGCCVLLVNYPRILAFIYGFIPNRFPLLRVSAMQSLALSGKVKIACCAFFIAATSNIGMNLMVDSFRGATLGWLEQRMVADYYIYNTGEPNIKLLASGTDLVVEQRLEKTIVYKNKEIQQFSQLSTVSHQESMVFYDDGKSDKKELWIEFDLGKSIFVNQQFAFGFDYDVGDVVDLPHPSSGELLPFKILAITYDFGNPYAQVLLPQSMFESSNAKCCMYALKGSEDDIDILKDRMLEVGLDHSKQLYKTDELLAVSMQTFDNTFIITDGLNIVTLLVAALSLACAIIVLMNDVRPQNMLLRSMGVSAFKTQSLALFQYLLLCFIALIFATPFGILLSWILIFDINYQAFAWTYPVIISPLKILQVYVTSFIIVVAVVAIPIIRVGKRPLIEDIRWVN